MFKRFRTLFAFFLSLFALTAQAWEIPPASQHFATVEVGTSLFIFNNYHPAQQIALASYHSEWKYAFTEVIAGGWGASRNTYLAGGSIGFSLYGFSIGTGAGWLTRRSDALGTHWQLIQTFRYTLPMVPIFIGFRHFSNGERIFRHGQQPNHGENFIVIGAQYAF